MTQDRLMFAQGRRSTLAKALDLIELATSLVVGAATGLYVGALVGGAQAWAAPGDLQVEVRHSHAAAGQEPRLVARSGVAKR
jgi:hypothetical protein